MSYYWFWTILCALTVIWYVVVTAIVTFKGGADIREMLKDIKEEKQV